MKRPRRHATRNPLGLLPKRKPGAAVFSVDRLLGLLQLSGKSALSVGLALLMLVFIGLLVANFVGQVMQSARLESQRADLEAEVAQMEAENLRLSGAVAFTESDVYVERIARSQLGYAREGDIVILPRLAPPSAAQPLDPAASPQGPPAPPPIPNWRLWWDAFFPHPA